MWSGWFRLAQAFEEAMNTEDTSSPSVLNCHIFGVTMLIIEARKEGVTIPELKQHFDGWASKWKPASERREKQKVW